MIFCKNESEFVDSIKMDITEFAKPGERIAVKIHMGEKGNKTFVNPEFTKKIIKIMKDNGAKPFLFDSPVMYEGGRDTPSKYLATAKSNGYSEKEIGCPVIISEEPIFVKTEHLRAEVCSELANADGMLVISHGKGHMCSGFGGAIKNLGMGGVTKKTKLDIHRLSNPVITDDCKECGACVRVCPVGAITLEEKLIIDTEHCWGCGVCINTCPEHALKAKVAPFDVLLAEGAFAVYESVKKSYYINVLVKISKFCDCAVDNGPMIASDVGYIASGDIVAADRKSIELINKHANSNIFLKENKKDPYAHVEAMRQLIEKENKK